MKVKREGKDKRADPEVEVDPLKEPEDLDIQGVDLDLQEDLYLQEVQGEDLDLQDEIDLDLQDEIDLLMKGKDSLQNQKNTMVKDHQAQNWGDGAHPEEILVQRKKY